MDSFMQMNEHRGDEMDELVCQPAREVSEINISSPIQPGPFLIESQPGAAQLRDRMNAGQTVRAERYRSRMDLRPALIRGRGLAAKCAKAGSQRKMGERHPNVLEYYGFESGRRGKQTLPRRISLGKFMKEEAASSDVHKQGEQRTRVEEKLSMLEAKLHISIFIRGDMRIIRSGKRCVDRLSYVHSGDIIKASEEDVQGKMEHLRVKRRLLNIYYSLRFKLVKKIGKGAKAFISLERFVKQYVFKNREVHENRRKAEEKEAKAFTALKLALVRVNEKSQNKCGKYAAILLGLLTEESNGYLEVPHDGVRVRREDTDITCAKTRCKYKDCTDMPLFTHRPNIKDIVQGNLGDCYLLTGLISVVDQNPEEIMNIMRDNGDGTVTVCFKLEEPGENGGTVFTPCYVTVRKSIPVLRPGGRDAFSRGAFWVKMMEKAYAASGIHLLGKMNQYRKKHRQAPLKYSAFLKQMQDERRKLDYDEIKGGWPGQFVSLLLGKKSKFHFPGRYGRQRGGAAAEHGNAEQIQDGYYTPGEIQLYEGISESLKSGTYISFATKKLSQNRNGRNGEGVQAGVVGTHAYSIINTCRRRSGNMERRYVVVMNPWANYGMFYRAGEGEIRKFVANGEKEEGVFLMDLKTFAEVVSCWETVSA